MNRHLAALLLLLPLAGCIQDRKPVSTAKSIAEIDAELAKRREAIRDFDATISMSVEGLKHSGSLSGRLAFEPPGRMRFDAFKQMGPALFSFVMVGDRFLLHNVAEGTAIAGSVAAHRREHPELGAAMAWLDDRPEPGDERTIEEEAADHVVVATRRGGVLVRRQRIELPSLFVTRVWNYAADGGEVSAVELSDYRAVKPPAARPGPEAWMPWVVAVSGRTPEGAAYRLRTKMQIVYLNEGLDAEMFDLSPPEGVTVEEAK